MKRYGLSLLLLLLSMMPGCGRVSTDLFPLDEGTAWKYSFKGLTASGFVKITVAGKEKMDKGTGIILEITRDFVEGEDHELFEKSDTLVTAYKEVNPAFSYIETSLKPAMPFLQLKANPGDTWEWKGSIFGMQSSSTFVAEKRETITCSGKRYHCLKVLEKGRASDGREYTCGRWFSGGYGKVREEALVSLKGKTLEQSTLELVEFQSSTMSPRK